MKQRLVGAAVIMALGVIFIPIFLAPDEEPRREQNTLQIERNNDDDKFSSKVQPIEDEIIDALRSDDPQWQEPTDGIPQPNQAQTAIEDFDNANNTSDRDERSNLTNQQATKEQVGITAWVVQVGSFSSRENAEKLVGDLKAKAYTAYIESITRGNPSYRVRIGPLLSKARAQQTADSLQQSLNLQGIVLKYP